MTEGETDERRTRRVTRDDDDSRVHRDKGGGEAADKAWAGIIRGVVDLDVEAVHKAIRVFLDRKPEATASQVGAVLERVGHYYAEASTLAAKARHDYELLKESHGEWLETKRSAALVALEELKKEKDLKKQITEAMITDQVRATWPDEYALRVGRLKAMQAAIHALEALPDAVRQRGTTLSKMGDLVLATGRR